MARSKLQQMMEKDVEGLRNRAESCRIAAAADLCEAEKLEALADNYESLIDRASSFEASVSAREVEEVAQLDEEEGF